MMNSMDLSGIWQVTWSDGVHGFSNLPNIQYEDSGRYMDVPVPMELHVALQEKQLVADPNLGINSLTARWVEEQYWQYRTTFHPPAAALSQTAWLVFEQLDLNAAIILNGETVGKHANAHCPCRINVTGKLQRGENKLIVLLESGLYGIRDLAGSDYHHGMDTALTKRHWLRKPQYQFGWDWNPRLVNVGITGPVRLEWTRQARLDQVTVWCKLAEDKSVANLRVRAFIEGLNDVPSCEAILAVRVRETKQEVKKAIQIAQGMAPYEIFLAIENPLLWWPKGHGEQPLYTIDLFLKSGKHELGRTTKRIGIRSVQIDQSPHPENGRYFTLIVNGRRIFCKGGNWVPPDLIPSTIDRTRIRQLVQLAVDANFNFLRIWGGGQFAGHDLLDACDEAGIMVWQDMLFACAKYPGDDPGFVEEVRREIIWAVREFAHHASLALWCGNNEIEWIYGDYQQGKSLPDHVLYHRVIPFILRDEDPINRPYWPGSPYSPDHGNPNDPYMGDQHPWGVSILDQRSDFWRYREYEDRFASEGGVLGASTPATLRQFLPENERRVRSFTWEHHDNLVNFWKQELGPSYEAFDRWLGRPYTDFNFEEYVFASALLQAEGLSEYIANYRRRMFSSSSAIFWMYNDSWPVIHGWTIVDYYRRRKLAYHPVRRGFQPVTVVLAQTDKGVAVYGVNDSPVPWNGLLRYGLFAMSGGVPVDYSKGVLIPANASTVLSEVSLEQWEKLGVNTHGGFALLEKDGQSVAQHRLFLARFKDLQFARPKIRITQQKDLLTLVSPTFVWGVCLDLDGEKSLSDNCFDLLPGIPYALRWPTSLSAPTVLRTGNELLIPLKKKGRVRR